MTSTDKPIKRETRETYRGRPLMIELFSTYMTIRQKGKVKRFTVTYSQMYTAGAVSAAAEIRRDRAEKRKAAGINRRIR